MNTFKKQLEKDRAVFFNLNEFGEQKRINGEVCTVVVDNDLVNERLSLVMDREGVHRSQVTFFVRESALGFKPVQGDTFPFGDVDGEDYPYTVTHVSKDRDILEVTMEANR